jgi:hypothetical protein
MLLTIFPHGIPHNSIILLGTATSLLHQGSSGYIFEWISCARKITARWPTANICPLPPILNDTAPGQLFRTVMETASVFKNLFEDGPRGLGDVWTSVLNSMRVSSGSVNTLGTPDVYTLPFPSDLSGQQHLNNVTFSTSCPCPAVVNRPDRKATSSIVRTLVASLNRDLSAGLDPAIISARVAEADGPTAAQDIETPPAKRFVVFGASHMKRVVPLMLAQGCSVADLTIPGWMPNGKITQSCAKLWQASPRHRGPCSSWTCWAT